MAGPFYNPQAGMGIEAAGASAVVSPVAPVRTSGADAVTAGLNLASQGVALYAQDQRYKGRYGGTRSGRPDPNLARFSEEVQIALRNKEQFGEGRFKMDMNRIVQNFGSAGQAIDEDMLTYFEQTTGLPSDTYFGVDPVEKFKAAQFQTPEIQAAAAPLIAAGMDPEKALNQALEEQQTFTRLAENLSQADTQNAAKYMAPKGGQEIQQGIIQHFRETAYSRLNALVNTGKATEQDARIVLSNYQALLATPKMQIPSGVSAEVRSQEIASRDNLKGSIETVVKLLDAGEQGQSILQQIVQNPGMPDEDKMSMFANFALLSPTKAMQLFSFMPINDLNDVVKSRKALGDISVSNFELGNLNNVTAKGLATAPPGQTPPPEEIVPPELSDAINKLSPSELRSFTNGNAKKASFPGWDFNSQEDVKAFATSVYSVAQGLTAPQQNRLRTIDDLGKLLNRNIFKNLDSLDKVDPEQAALLRASLGVGLTTELTRRKVQLSSIEKSLVGDATADGITTAKFNPETGKYELTPEFIDSQTPEDMKSFQVGVEYAYGGDLAKGAENNFVRLTTARSPNQGPGDASKVVSDGNLIRIEDAQRNRRATAALQQFYSSLDAGGQLPPLAQEFSDPSAEARRVAATVAGTAPMDQGQTRNQRSEVTLTPTNIMTSAGRRLYETSEGELVSELTVTVQDPNSKLYYNIPSVNNGTMMSVDEAAELYFGKGEVKDVETGRVIQGFETVEEAVDAARARTQNLNQGQTMDQAPPPPIVQPAGATSGVSDTLMDTLALIESGNNPNAVSSAGARGLYQLMPETAAKPGFKVKPLSTGSDIDAAPVEEQRRFSKDYLSAMLKRYDGDLALALAAYNGGAGRVDDYIKDGKALPTETVQYVQKFVDQGQVPQENSVSSGKVVEPSSGPGLVSRVGTAIGQALSSPAQAAPLPDSMLPPGFRSTDSQGLRPEAGAEVTESSMLGSLISSVRSALNLGSDEEAQSVAEKLMQSGIIPRRPEGLSGDEPMRLPPVRGSEQNNLPPSNPRLAAAQLRQQRKDQDSIALNSESLAQLDPSTAESIINLGAPVAGLVLRQLPWANVQAFGQYLSKGKVDIKDVPFNKSDVELIKEKVSEALAKGKNRLDYPDWGVTGKGVLVGGLLGTAQKSVTDPNFRMATFLGQVGIRKAPNGDIILVDKYDFNPGPKGDKLKEALLARETGDAATYEKLKEEALGGLSWLEATRVWAATLKISDEPAEEFTINLGKLD